MYFTEDQSDWIKFGYEESQIDMFVSRKSQRRKDDPQSLFLPLRLRAFA